MTDQRPPSFDPESIGFHITSNDHELLIQIRRHLQKNGYLAIADTAGRLHYIMDGSRGVPYAARRVLETAERQSLERSESRQQSVRRLPEAVETVLDRLGIRTELKGRSFLREILMTHASDERQLNPSCKTIYPETAKRFHVSSSQVERDIRYAFACARQENTWPGSLSTGNSACISHLCSEVRRELRLMEQGTDSDCQFRRAPGTDDRSPS